jgi:hypothetical protein
MIEGDIVTVTNREGEWLIVDIEKPHDHALGTSCDMGRYTILAKDGTEISNHPGYLMQFVRHWEKVP